MINSNILDPAFTAKELLEAYKNVNIGISRSAIYEYVRNPLNPITATVADDPLVANSKIFKTDKKSATYYLRPKHRMLGMVRDVAYYREYEWGHKDVIAHYEVFEDILSSEDMAIVEDLYTQSKWKPPAFKKNWQDRYYYFTDISDETRTPIDDNMVTRASKFKVAFLDAIVPTGNFTSSEIQLYTGIHPETLSDIFRQSSYIRDARRVFVEADTIWEAKEKVQERGYAVPIGNKKYMVQLASTIRKREEHEYTTPPPKPQPIPKKVYKSPYLIKKGSSLPEFQTAFLMKTLQRVYHRATGKKFPRQFTVQKALDFIKNQ